ncbi:MAG: 3-oxoacyl-ACP synthase, partial [Clostridiales bacterium]|nr:3-oxoacyl-ACP synthase [Clostridiales bacterium]
MSFQIVGTGRSNPAFVLTNEMVSKIVDTDDEWITSRTGIKTRFISTNETLEDLATEASKRALESAGIEGREVDLIICSTFHGEYLTPSLSCLIQLNIGASCPAFDINAACTGFVYGLDIADAYFSSGKAETILVVAAEAMTRHIDWSDRST